MVRPGPPCLGGEKHLCLSKNRYAVLYFHIEMVISIFQKVLMLLDIRSIYPWERSGSVAECLT